MANSPHLQFYMTKHHFQLLRLLQWRITLGTDEVFEGLTA
jgi:hypothetical protein